MPGAVPVVLNWPDCRNVRDVATIATAAGARIRAMALIRSDSLARLTPTGVRRIQASGIRRIVDLRGRQECQRHPNPFAGRREYRHAPMLSEVLDYDPPPDTYAPMLDRNRHRIVAAFRVVAEAPPGGVVVHCEAGKDRTGVLVALLLSVAGVHPRQITRDYARSPDCCPATMARTLAHLDYWYRGAERYLTGGGLAPQLLAAVRARLVVPDQAGSFPQISLPLS